MSTVDFVRGFSQKHREERKRKEKEYNIANNIKPTTTTTTTTNNNKKNNKQARTSNKSSVKEQKSKKEETEEQELFQDDDEIQFNSDGEEDESSVVMGGQTKRKKQHKEVQSDILFKDESKLLKSRKDSVFETEQEQKERKLKTLKDNLAIAKETLSKKQEEDASKYMPFLKDKIPKLTSPLDSKNFHIGMIVLASLDSITDMDITLSLPFGMKGYIDFSELSDEFTAWVNKVNALQDKTNFQKSSMISDKVKSMFLIGQMIKCAVVGMTDNIKKPGLHCTLRANLINRSSSITENFMEGMNIYGSVESSQDKGYIVTIGEMDGYKGFIEHANTSYYWPIQDTVGEPVELSIGQPIVANILSIDKETKIVKLSVAHPMVSRAVVKDSSVVSIESIKAGMMVDATIVKVLPNGIYVTFLDFFSGEISIIHCDKELSKYEVGRKLRARVIFVDQMEKRIGLSCLAHVLGFRPYKFGAIKTGQPITNAKVYSVDQDRLHLDITISPDQKLKGLIHIKSTDKKATNFIGEITKGAVIKTSKVLHIDGVDGVLTLTTRKRDLDRQILSYHDLEVGQILDGDVKIIRDDSIELILAPGIYGVVPLHSIGETLIKDINAKFKVSQKVKCRVLRVIPEKNRLVLTLKQSLIQSTLPILSQLSKVQPGSITHGFITKLTDSSVFVSFYGDVFGIVNRSEMGIGFDKLVHEVYSIGQVVVVRVLSVTDRGLRLSFNIDEEEEEEEEKENNTNNKNNNKNQNNKNTNNNNNIANMMSFMNPDLLKKMMTAVGNNQNNLNNNNSSVKPETKIIENKKESNGKKNEHKDDIKPKAKNTQVKSK